MIGMLMAEPQTIMPCFSRGRHEAEGIIIGHLLAGYGELELEMAMCVGHSMKSLDSALRLMFKKRGEQHRIKLARTNLKHVAKSVGLEALSNQILGDMEWCKAIRNQYAHCTWYPTTGSGLGFVNLEEVALVVGPTGPLENYRRCIDVDFLTKQEEFFVYLRHCFWHLGEQLKNWAEGSSNHYHTLPSRISPPRLHI